MDCLCLRGSPAGGRAALLLTVTPPAPPPPPGQALQLLHQLSWANQLPLAEAGAAAEPRLQALQVFARQLLHGTPAGPGAGLCLKQQLAKLQAGSPDWVAVEGGQPLLLCRQGSRHGGRWAGGGSGQQSRALTGACWRRCRGCRPRTDEASVVIPYNVVATSALRDYCGKLTSIA
jgi:hypothetical protein